MNTTTPRFSIESTRCGPALGSRIISSSADCGWTSILLDHHRVEPTYDVFETRPTPDQTIVVMLSGSQVLESFGGGTWQAAPYHSGTIGMTAGGTVDRLRRRWQHGQAAFEKANLYVPQKLFQEAFELYRRAGQNYGERRLEALAFHDPLVAQTVSSLLRGMQSGLPDLYAQAAACWLATHLVSVHGGRIEPKKSRLPPMSDRRLEAVCALMRGRFAEPLTLDTLATEAGLSKFHFARLFRHKTGAAPHAYLLQVRLEAACRLLVETDLRIKQIAAQTGFHTVASFGTAFARKQGVTPSVFRHSTWSVCSHLK